MDFLMQAMLALARLHLLVDDLDSCQQQCSQLLEMDKDNDSAFMVKISNNSLIVHTFPNSCVYFTLLIADDG
jgi:hypothetical protein